MSADFIIRDHKALIGYLQPDGLVVSPAALVDSQIVLDRHVAPLQRRFLDHVEEVALESGAAVQQIRDVRGLLTGFLEWPEECLVREGIPDELTSPLPEFGETLTPTMALRAIQSDAGSSWLLLVSEVRPDTDLDARTEGDASSWSASPTQRFERLLRDTRVPIGLLTNRRQIRLIYAPRGENSGALTFPVAPMCEVGGRMILSAFERILGQFSLFSAPTRDRLPGLLQRSRDYQARVSTALAAQVLDALYELTRGFQAANERSKGVLLAQVLETDPDLIYRGLLNTLMRLVFLLFAEDRGLMPDSALYQRNYAVHGLFERLRADASRYPDTMDQRYGAWAQLLALFRAVHSGCRHAAMRMPARQGYLFDPARFPFLEGASDDAGEMPLVADGVVFRVLDKLLMLDGERLSYRTLDVEQIGSVYETMMGFQLEVAKGTSIALKPAKAHGAPAVVDLEALLAKGGEQRAKWLKDHADQALQAAVKQAVAASRTVADLLAALERRIARNATPSAVPAGALLLQPTDARRRSGSHYTPRSLTEPIVRTTLQPVLAQLGDNPSPAQVLELKVCDPAVGSGAFLVEACRQLAEVLVKAWHAHAELPALPPDEDELLLARRLVAQRCLYGVDRNPMAVDLAKLSLWLATLARDHPFTFLDHAIRAGDSLVGLTRRQIADLDWKERPGVSFGQERLVRHMEAVTSYRRKILAAGDDLLPAAKAQQLALAEQELEAIRESGDIVLAGFFSAGTDGTRRRRLDDLRNLQMAALRPDFFTKQDDAQLLDRLDRERAALKVLPFHWQIEFPEVFDRAASGFDAIVGNPPFAGKNTLINSNAAGYLDWLKTLHEESHGNADLVAHFFRRAFGLLRPGGSMGLIATNTIAQGDTRSTGLRWICTHGGAIYAARKRYKWPGIAAVVVSVVHVFKGEWTGEFLLDGRSVPTITAFLFHAGGHEDPLRLEANAGRSFQGSIVLGMGFTFDDTDQTGVASPIAEMHRLIANDPRNAERIFPYLGGEEVNDSPTHSPHRYVINFGNLPLQREQVSVELWAGSPPDQQREWLRSGIVPNDYPHDVAADWPDLLDIVERNVRPERRRQGDLTGKRLWWRHLRPRGELYQAIDDLEHVLAINCGACPHMAFARLANHAVFANTLAIFAVDPGASFALLQSRIHEVWARTFSSTLEDRLRYTPSDCFETFPFPRCLEARASIAEVGDRYYKLRSDLMVRTGEGFTKIYNRFNDREEVDPDIWRLREAHAELDRAVLDAYGWTDIRPTNEFALEYEDDDNGDILETSRRRKPWRYRWPYAIRDEVLARLMLLNHERAAEEERSGVRARSRRPVSDEQDVGDDA